MGVDDLESSPNPKPVTLVIKDPRTGAPDTSTTPATK